MIKNDIKKFVESYLKEDNNFKGENICTPEETNGYEYNAENLTVEDFKNNLKSVWGDNVIFVEGPKPYEYEDCPKNIKFTYAVLKDSPNKWLSSVKNSGFGNDGLNQIGWYQPSYSDKKYGEGNSFCGFTTPEYIQFYLPWNAEELVNAYKLPIDNPVDYTKNDINKIKEVFEKSYGLKLGDNIENMFFD